MAAEVSAKAPGQAWAWRFRYAVRELENAYMASRATTDADVAQINQSAEAHQEKVDAGEASWTEEDEDGYPVYDYGEHLGERMYEAEQVLRLVRNAFVISLHHLVEQKVGAQLVDKKYTEPAGLAWLKSFGWSPKEAELKELRLAANCAKHSGGSSTKQLYALRPDMFDETVEGWGADPSAENLTLSDDHVTAFFEAVKSSVPKLPPAF